MNPSWWVASTFLERFFNSSATYSAKVPLANIWNPAICRENLLWVINGHPAAVPLFK
jgi:hypothetical protein